MTKRWYRRVRVARLAVCMGIMGWSACAPSPVEGSCLQDRAFDWYLDVDGDGYGDPETVVWSYCAEQPGRIRRGEDCADGDATIHPGAEEIWYDGIDQDCDGASDFDQDADGFLALQADGADCDDLDSAVYPGAPEVWYDDIDQGCDGGDDYDQDQDGFTALVGGGDDCDDADPLTYPGAPEGPTGSDSDCNGIVDDVTLARTTQAELGEASVDPGMVVSGGASGLVAFGLQSAAIGDARWLAPMPLPASSVGITSTRGAVYLSGGAGGSGSSGGITLVSRGNIEADGRISTWDALTPLPVELAGHTMMTDGSCLVVVGGGSPATGVLTQVLTAPIQADGTIGMWSPQAAYPLGVSQARGVYTRGGVIITGGSVDGTATTGVYRGRLDADCSIDSWEAQPPMPLALSYHNALVTGGRLYVLGGQSSSVWRAVLLDDGTISHWLADTPLPTTCWGSAATVLGGHVLVSGGDVGGTMSDVIHQAEILPDGRLSEWTVMEGALPQPRRFQTATTWGDRAYVVGGWTNVDTVSVERTDEVVMMPLDQSLAAPRVGRALYQTRFDLTLTSPVLQLEWSVSGSSALVSTLWMRTGLDSADMGPWTRVDGVSPYGLQGDAHYVDVLFELEDPTGAEARLEELKLLHR